MSNKTFNMSAEVEHTVPLPQRALQLDLSSECRYSNLLSTSPDSMSSISNLSNREEISSPDVNMLQCCISDCSPVDNPYNNTFQQSNVLCSVSTNLNQTFIATPVNGSVDFWNENMTVWSNHEAGSEKFQTCSKTTEDGSYSAVTSPDSADRESQPGSCETSRRGSTENDYSSLSSGEMVIRNNSFCLEDQSLLVVSSLEETSFSLPAGHPALPAESNLLSTALQDVCEKSPEKVAEENIDHLCLGMTFTQAELPTEENDVAASNSLVALPSESEGGLLMTFVCETSPADCGKEAQFTIAEAQMPHFPDALTPEQGKTFVSTLSAVQDTDKDIHTSTPIQHVGNKIPSLPCFSESPCTGNTGNPGLHPVKQQQISITPKQRLIAGLLPSASKVKKMEIKKFPKSDFSSVKSKVVTRNVHHMSVPGSASQHKPSHINVNSSHTEAQRGAAIRISPAKVRSSTAVVSTNTQMISNAQGQVNTGTGNLYTAVRQSFRHRAADRQGKSPTTLPCHQLQAPAKKRASAVQCIKAISETKHAALSQVADTAAQHAGNKTLCLSSLEKSLEGSGQADPKQSPKKDMSNKIEVRSGSALGQDKSPLLKSRLRCSSESSSSSSRPPKEKKNTLRLSNSFTIPKTNTHLAKTKPGNLNCSSQSKQAIQAEAYRSAENSAREVKKISLLTESSKSTTAGVSFSDKSKSGFRGWPCPRRTRGGPLSHASAASPRPDTLSTRQRQTTLGRDECRTSTAVGTPQSKQKTSAGSQTAQAAGEQSPGTAFTASIKLQVIESRPPQTPFRPSLGLPPTPASRPPRKTQGPSKSLTEASVHSELNGGAGSKQVSGRAAHKPTPLKTVLKSRLITTPVKNTGQLDKNKPKTSSHQQPAQQQASQPSQSNGPPDVVPASVAEGGRKDRSIQQLRELLAASNCRFEAVSIVLQQILAERDEATRQCRDLSQELVNLRGELVCSVHSSERLEKERDELRVALEDTLQKVQKQHQKDLAELEERLQAFYQAEWDKVHLSYQEEADKCKTLMQQQIGDLKADHEATKVELEQRHAEQLRCDKQQYEMSLEELCKIHTQELQSLDKSLKDAEAALSGQIEALTVENKALAEKLTAEENRRKQLADKSQKDSHTLYLEQELESLKVVLDIKNKQLHQQEENLMEIDKLKEKNVKLNESLNKAQQENEDLKARLDRHTALSRQLSTEQAVLQESLQKESKVNKRLSMENEELLWKLHNGDLSSPRKLSPTSTSHSFSLQSPRSSGLLSSPPVSPR
uniref:microtubule-associated tumor suppressor 1 homolog A isoform X3 n=1 Tax=Scatophagus argus TaxID=75038 RepID=UPI001ED7E6CC|nr:microtubule-associated tumor suppressor 1 homolog A isoform X3 [Scatophagus argus]